MCFQLIKAHVAKQRISALLSFSFLASFHTTHLDIAIIFDIEFCIEIGTLRSHRLRLLVFNMSEQQSQLDVLKKKKEQLNARIQKLESLQKSRERKRDMRRKILIGAYFIDKATEDGSLNSLFQQLDGYLKRNSDRELFYLDPMTQEKESELNKALEEI